MGLIGKRYKQGGYVDSRYYKPMLEEFHVGFEYEAHCFKVDVCQIPDDIEIDEYFKNYDKYPQVNRIDTGWKKSIVGNGLFETTEDIPVLLRNDAARVKYLDKSDIEELGFTFLKADEETYLVYYIKEDVVLAYMDIPTTQWIEIYTTKTYDPNGSRIVKAIINNKSELKVLLNQLGIS